MTEQGRYTDADMDSLNAKLQTFTKTLSPGESNALSSVFYRAAKASSEVAGYDSDYDADDPPIVTPGDPSIPGIYLSTPGGTVFVPAAHGVIVGDEIVYIRG
jgi:hypothetical protein